MIVHNDRPSLTACSQMRHLPQTAEPISKVLFAPTAEIYKCPLCMTFESIGFDPSDTPASKRQATRRVFWCGWNGGDRDAS